MSHPAGAGAMNSVEIRNGLRAGHVFVIMVKLGIGLCLSGVAAYGSWQGAPAGMLAFAWIAGLVFVGLGLIHLQTGLDKTAQLTLSAEGFRDHRSGGKLIPWSQVRRIRNHGNAMNILDLELAEDAAVGADPLSGAGNLGSSLRRVRIPLDALDTTAREMMAHIQRFAPQLAPQA